MQTLPTAARPCYHSAAPLIGAVLWLLCWLIPTVAAAQAAITGQVLDATTQAPVPYASIGVLHRPAGVVADDQGRFTVEVLVAYAQDSLRVRLLGYASLTVPVAAFRRQLAQTGGPILLRPAPTELAEVVVRPGQLTRCLKDRFVVDLRRFNLTVQDDIATVSQATSSWFSASIARSL